MNERPLPLSDDTNSSLLSRVRNQDADGWVQLIRWIGPFILRWCRKAALQDSDTQEVSQQVTIKIWERLGTFRKEKPADSFRGWVYAITRNCLHDFHERKRREAGPLPLVDLPAESDPTEAAELEQEALRLLVEGLLARWGSDPGFRAFYRTTVDGMSAPEVAAELGMSPDSVRQHKSRWVKRARELFGEQFGELLD